jgi:hypothetical protein
LKLYRFQRGIFSGGLIEMPVDADVFHGFGLIVSASTANEFRCSTFSPRGCLTAAGPAGSK